MMPAYGQFQFFSCFSKEHLLREFEPAVGDKLSIDTQDAMSRLNACRCVRCIGVLRDTRYARMNETRLNSRGL
jgi:hypothetical protein